MLSSCIFCMLCRTPAPVKTAVSLIDAGRAHLVCVELAGLKCPADRIKHALMTMDVSVLPEDTWIVLQRHVPSKLEAEQLELYAQGRCKEHPGLSDVARLGPCERCDALHRLTCVC